MQISQVCVRQAKIPLLEPYRVSLMTMRMFDPFIVQVSDGEGNYGFGETLIVPGYTAETVEGSWKLCNALAMQVVGMSAADAKHLLSARVSEGAGAVSALLSAVEMLMGHPTLHSPTDVRIPLLAPLNAHEPVAMAEEIKRLLEQGFRTLKVKVGFDWEDDLERVQQVQDCLRGRATIRLDANQGYDVEDGKAFAQRLDPSGIELFEQPCHMDDWAANAAVAEVSAVPVMLDESIYDASDIARAAGMKGVGFVKLKLKKIGGLDMLANALLRIRDVGMTPVLGDGVSLEIGCWMEACVATQCIDNAGEMNGFLKASSRLFETPLPFERGEIRIPAGFRPRLDESVLARHTLRKMDYP